jgi:hypothetical protein
MTYDPQANRRRPKPGTEDSAPVDALLGEPTANETSAPTHDDPPPEPAVTPAPADPPSDRWLLSSGVISAAGGVMALMVVRHLWKRNQSGQNPPSVE